MSCDDANRAHYGGDVLTPAYGDRRPASRGWVKALVAAAISAAAAVFHRRLSAVERIINQLEERMTSVESQAWDQLGALIAVVVAEVQSLREGIAQKDAALQAAQEALANADANTQQQVADALAADSAADVDRVLAYTDQLKAAAPVEVPEVPVPDPGQPAEPPADSGVEVPDSGSSDSGSGDGSGDSGSGDGSGDSTDQPA